MWHCCATSVCEFLCPLGDNDKSHSPANGHLKAKNDIVGRQPGTVVARTTAAATWSVVESEETQIGAARVKNLNTALLLITAFLLFVHVEPPFSEFRCADDSHDQLRPQRGMCGRVQRGGVRTVRLGRRFDRNHLRGIRWRYVKKKVEVQVSALFQGRTQKTQVQVSAIFQSRTLWKSVTFSSW